LYLIQGFNENAPDNSLHKYGRAIDIGYSRAAMALPECIEAFYALERTLNEHFPYGPGGDGVPRLTAIYRRGHPSPDRSGSDDTEHIYHMHIQVRA
jgi:hypothetical protein